jgi:hypothetical protein
MNDQTNPHNNSNPLIITHEFNSLTFVVIDSTLAILAQSIIHINVLTIIHNRIKSTNGSSSRNEHNFVMKFLIDTLKFQENKPNKAKNIMIEDLHNTLENSILMELFSAFTTGNNSKHTVRTTK